MVDVIIFVMETTKAFAAFALKFVSAEVLVLLIAGAGLALYLFLGTARNTKRAIARKKNKFQEKIWSDYVETRIRLIFDVMNGDNKEAFIKGCELYLKENNYKLTRAAIQRMIYDNLNRKKGENLRCEYAYCDEGKDLVDAIFKTVQIGLKEGPEYENLQKQIESKVKKQMKDMKFDVDSAELSKQVNETVSKNLKEHAFDNFDMQNQMQQQMQMDMQNQMQMDMQIQMQLQMQMDMQNQMQQQMQMDMMNQMQQQMQMDMQNQMQQQMQMDMMNQMTQQMSMDSMSMANQAMSSTDSGGFMNHDMHSGNFGPF